MYADREHRSTRHASTEYKANAVDFGMGSRRERSRSPITRAVANPGELALRFHSAVDCWTDSMQTGLGDAEGGGEIQVARRIYVGNLSYSVAWQDLKDHFKPIGEGIDRCCYSGCR